MRRKPGRSRNEMLAGPLLAEAGRRAPVHEYGSCSARWAARHIVDGDGSTRVRERPGLAASVPDSCRLGLKHTSKAAWARELLPLSADRIDTISPQTRAQPDVVRAG
jgi:hypothetical protein